MCMNVEQTRVSIRPCLIFALQSAPKEKLYKILVIGDLGTGKTSIIKRYVHQCFSPHYRATVSLFMFLPSGFVSGTLSLCYNIVTPCYVLNITIMVTVSYAMLCVFFKEVYFMH